MKKWLVEIKFVENLKVKLDHGVIEYYEIEAEDVYSARKTAKELFENEFKEKAWIKKYMKQFSVYPENQWYVGVAIEV